MSDIHKVEELQTWDDVRRAAYLCPVLHQAVTLADRGVVTREAALIAAALWFSENRRKLLEQEMQRLSGMAAPAFRLSRA